MTGDVAPSGNAGRPGLPGVAGAEVARRFYGEAVAPVLAREFPRLRYAAARLGSGSDVLGLDDAMSRDHDWGCRLTLLVDSADATAVPLVHEQLERSLPASWRGQPARFATTWDASVSHQVEVAAVGDFARSRLGIDPLAGLTVVDWLMLTGQGVLEVTAGPVFTDQTSELGRLRERLRWYPDDVDRYVLAAGWQQVSHRLPMHGRAADRGDDAGSRVIAATIVADLMRLALLAHRRWPPYEKWLGTAVRALPGGPSLAAALSAAVAGPGWREREAAIVTAAAQIAEGQRDRTGPGPEPLFTQFWDRPYRDVNPVLIEGLRAAITDRELARLPHDVGSIDQWVNDVEVLGRPARSALAAAYRAWLAEGGPAPPAGRDRHAGMGVIQVSAERTVSAPADEVFGYIRDMNVHPKFLPPAFSDFHVESGGVGTGMVTFKVTAGGRTRDYRMTVDEPEPGRVLRESDSNSSLITKFTVTPREGAGGAASHVEISTSWQGAGGIGGFFERTFAPRAMKVLYEDELQRLDTYAREQQGR